MKFLSFGEWIMGVLPAFNSRSHVSVIAGNSTAYLDNIAIALPLGIGLCSLSLLTFLGNAMVVHAIRTERKLHTVCTLYYVFITDLVFLYFSVINFLFVWHFYRVMISKLYFKSFYCWIDSVRIRVVSLLWMKNWFWAN